MSSEEIKKWTFHKSHSKKYIFLTDMRHCDYFFRKIKSKNPDNPTDQITDPTRPTRHSKSGLGILFTGTGTGTGFFGLNWKIVQEYRTGKLFSPKPYRNTGQGFFYRNRSCKQGFFTGKNRPKMTPSGNIFLSQASWALFLLWFFYKTLISCI